MKPKETAGVKDEAGFERLFDRLLISFKEMPVEDGMFHRGDEYVAAIVKEHGEEMLADRVLEMDNDCTKANVMQLVGRVEVPSTEVRRRLVREGLASEDIRVRDAAMLMVDLWEDHKCLDLLKDHKDSIDWLDKYARDIIEDLEG